MIAIARFGRLAVAALAVREQLGPDRTVVTRTSAFGIAAGAALWIAANIALLGGHCAIGQMATHANPIQAVNSIAFAIDTTASALLLVAFALIGAGMLGIAYVTWPLASRRNWAGFTAVLGLLMLVLAWTYASGPATYGSSWFQVPSPDPGADMNSNLLYGVATVSVANSWAVGAFSDGNADHTLALRWNGRKWRRTSAPDQGGCGLGDDLTSVTGTSPTDAWAVGYFTSSLTSRPQILIEH